jgi:hypothetical protein
MFFLYWFNGLEQLLELVDAFGSVACRTLTQEIVRISVEAQTVRNLVEVNQISVPDCCQVILLTKQFLNFS